MKIEVVGSVGSTNEYIKKYLNFREDIAVFADEQTGGRGTKGRSFLSNKGGVYLSILTFPSGLKASNSFSVMTHSAVAVCRTAEAFGLSPEIKWPNDVRAAGRKLAGILIENGLKGDRVDYSIVGIGLNVVNDLAPLGGIAVGMGELLPSPPAVGEVRERLIESYLRSSTFEDYLTYVRFLGKKIEVIEGERKYTAVAKQILTDGRLVVDSGESRILSSAEIVLL